MERVSIVIPTYNEAKNLPLLVEEIFATVDKNAIDLELIIVDDNSPDATGVVAEELSKKFPIKVLHRAGKLGLGSAVRAGFAASDRPILGVMDADLSHDPKTINEMVVSLKDHDLVLGSRFKKGSTVEQWKWWRKIISEVGVAITYLLTGVKDPLSGFFFLRREVIADVTLDTVGYKILLEILIKGLCRSTKEVPFQFRIRKFSTSKLDKKEYWLFLKQIIAYSWFKVKRWATENKWFGAIFLLAIGLLLYNVSVRTLWMDETAVLEYFKFSPGEFITAYWHRPDNHPPLYYFLVLLLSKVAPWTELMVRLVSILAGLGIIALVYRFAKRVTGDKTTAATAAFFTAFSSYFVLISQMARYHSLAAFSALLTFYFFYQLFVEGFKKQVWIWYLAAMVLVGYVDYPHFIYVVLITNALYLYRFFRRQPITGFIRWVIGQLTVAALCSPMAWMLYHRIFIQGDGGFDRTNLLANSWLHIVAGISFHIYSFFFGENVFPWNYFFFGLGLVVFAGMAFGLVSALRKKVWGTKELYVIGLSFALIVINTFFMNVADKRYNFIVYPKFGFVAFPLMVMSFVLCLRAIRSKKIQTALFVCWAVVASAGLWYFYHLENYLNASYFNTFRSFEFVRARAVDGQYVAITADLGDGSLLFYKQKYFSHLTALPGEEFRSSTIPKKSRVWLFATGADAETASVGTESLIPAGYTMVLRFDSVPLNADLKYWKEKILHRPSYTYKYTVFLLEKI